MERYLVLALSLIGTLPVGPFGKSALAQSETLTPRRADDACEFVGINVRLGSDPPYFEGTRWVQSRPLIRDLNIRNIRVGVGWKAFQNTNPSAGGYEAHLDSAAQRSQTETLYTNHGIRSLVMIGGIFQDNWGSPVVPNPGGTWNPPSATGDFNDENLINLQLTSIKNNYVNQPSGDRVFAIETQNEYDSDIPTAGIWGPRLNTYQIAVAQRRTALGLLGKPLTMPSINFLSNSANSDILHDNLGNLNSFANYGNLHYYTGFNIPGWELSTQIGHLYEHNISSSRKTLVTEFGSHTIPGVSTELAQAKRINRFVCEMMKDARIEKAYNYCLTDHPYLSAYNQRFWGLIKPGYVAGSTRANPQYLTTFTLKPGYHSLANFLGMLKEASWNTTSKTWVRSNFTPQPLNITFAGLDPLTQRLGFQKSNETYYVAMWRNLPTLVQTPFADKVNPEDGIGVVIPRCVVSAKVRRPLAHSNDWSYADRGTGTYGRTNGPGTAFPEIIDSSSKHRLVTFSVPDYVIALELVLGDPFLTTPYVSGQRTTHTGNVGYEFTPTQNITVKALGRPEATSGGMNQSHTVRIWRVSNQASVASVVVTPASAKDDKGNRYAVLTSPVTLSSGVKYRITSSEVFGASDKWLDYSSGNLAAHTSIATINGPVYSNGSVYPNLGNTTLPNSGYCAPVFYK